MIYKRSQRDVIKITNSQTGLFTFQELFNIKYFRVLVEYLCTHTARRSFATNFFDDGVPVQELMAVTGHTTEAAFYNYVRSKKETEFKGFLAVGANR